MTISRIQLNTDTLLMGFTDSLTITTFGGRFSSIEATADLDLLQPSENVVDTLMIFNGTTVRCGTFLLTNASNNSSSFVYRVDGSDSTLIITYAGLQTGTVIAVDQIPHVQGDRNSYRYDHTDDAGLVSWQGNTILFRGIS